MPARSSSLKVLASLLGALMDLDPDLVAVAGDIVEGKTEDLDGFLPALSLDRRARWKPQSKGKQCRRRALPRGVVAKLAEAEVTNLLTIQHFL